MSELILGIESSCDETSAAVVEDGEIIKSNLIASQIQVHQKYGGVVPEIASRKHLEYIIPVIDKALKIAQTKGKDLSGIAVTYGPGLIGSLLVGLGVAKALSYAWGIPLVGVNHLEAHIYANFLENYNLKPPFICLVVSGGHTTLVYVQDYGRYKIIGETRDDAAGEIFDKIAKFLNLGYPGGPVIERLAQKGNPLALRFPRPLSRAKGYDFSFSGLKTAVIYYLKDKINRKQPPPLEDILASFQKAAIDTLVEKTIKAVNDFKTEYVVLAGGVSANQLLRKTINEKAKAQNIKAFFPSIDLCTDNAAMVAAAGYYKLKNVGPSSLDLEAISRLKIGQ
ncbi:MAG: tRNA (adenosine(37)-N6)-threonylcarbamoyltransferase complex transferase subunit TsaD [Candidatus Caldatribacteriota bacterium]